MTTRIVKMLFGLALLPFCVGFTWQLGIAIFTTAYKPVVPYYFIGGGLAYLTLHLLFRKPILTYVIGHEMTHALCALFFGGSVSSLHASGRGGRVVLTKSNFIITLAPYFLPLYTVGALLLYAAARAAGAVPGALNTLVFLNGATFSFHLALTALFLKEDQTDIREEGALFSYPLIYLFNVGCAAFLVSVLLSRDLSYLAFLAGGIMRTVAGVAQAVHALAAIVARFS